MTGDVYQQTLKDWLMDELIENESKDFIYQQHGATPHLNDNLLRRWIGHAGDREMCC